MININLDEINEQFLLVLKQKTHEFLTIEKVSIKYSYIELWEHYKIKFIDKELYVVKDLKDLYIFLEENNIYAAIKFMHEQKEIKKSYCAELDKTYQTIDVEGNFKKILLVQEEFKDIVDNATLENSVNQVREFMKMVFQEIILVDKVIVFYSKYRELESDEDIIAYSHRKVGWNHPVFTFKNLSFMFDTNFGFGSSQYFNVILWYKNIKIIPFSEIIVYPFAEWQELKSYSKKLKCENQQWGAAMQFVVTANELLINDEKMFVQKYVLDEVNKLVESLKTIMTSSIFRRFTNDGFQNIEYSGRDLLLFRAQTVVYSLEFIPSIEVFKEIIDIQMSIKIIERLNQNIKPVIHTELDGIGLEINLLEENALKIDPLFKHKKESYDILDVKIDKFININRAFKKIQWSMKYLSMSLLDLSYQLALLQKNRWIIIEENEKKVIAMNYPHYFNEKKEYEQFKKEHDDLHLALKNCKEYKNKFTTLDNKLSSYFEQER